MSAAAAGAAPGLVPRGWPRTPGLLWAALVLSLGVTILVGDTGWRAYLAHQETATRIGIGGVPSAVAAARIHTLLASVNALATGALLADDERAALLWGQYAQELERLTSALITAAINIRSGQAERSPLLQLTSGLGEYQALIGRARALDGAAAVAVMNQAQALMDQRIIPQSAELKAASLGRVAAAYAAGAQQLPQSRFRLGWSTAALVLVLALTQLALALRFRRLVSGPLLLATLAAAVLLDDGRGRLQQASGWLDVARVQSLAGLGALTDARTAAFEARAAQALVLLNRGAEPVAAAFTARAGDLANGLQRAQRAAEGAGSAGGRRRQASGSALADATRFGDLNATILTLERQGRHAAAVAVSQGSEPGQNAWAFDQLDASLQQAIALDQDAFDAAVIQAFWSLKGYPWRLAAALGLVSALTLLGLAPRLRELKG